MSAVVGCLSHQCLNHLLLPQSSSAFASSPVLPLFSSPPEQAGPSAGHTPEQNFFYQKSKLYMGYSCFKINVLNDKCSDHAQNVPSAALFHVCSVCI